MSNVVIQAIGFAGVAFFLLSFQIKSNKKLFLMQLIGSALFCVQFILLGAFSGSVNLLAIMCRNALLMKVRDWPWVKSRKTMAAFLLVFTIIFVFTWQGPASILPFYAMVGTTIAYWTDNAQKIRLGILVFDVPGWLTYDFIVGSWGGILNELITLVSVLISIARYGWKSMGKSDSGF